MNNLKKQKELGHGSSGRACKTQVHTRVPPKKNPNKQQQQKKIKLLDRNTRQKRN
jgi:hypothetical protein